MQQPESPVIERWQTRYEDTSHHYVNYPRCTAHSRQHKVRCKSQAEPGFTVCRFHGGKSKVGIESGRYITGDRSKHMPARLRERYLESLQRPDLLSVRENVALLDGRLNELLEKLIDGQSPQLWHSATTSLERLKLVLYGPPTADKAAQVDTAFQALEKVLTVARDQDGVWHEILEVSRNQERLITAERTALREANQMLTVQQAMVLISKVSESVQRHVTDRKALAGISGDIQRLLHSPEPTVIHALRDERSPTD